MKKLFYLGMGIAEFIAVTFNIIFAYGNVDCFGCATMLFFAMTAITSVIIGWGARKLYNVYEEGKLDLFK